MGRHAGDMASWIGVAAGADALVIPEEAYDLKEIAETVAANRRAGKDHSLIVLAEGVMTAAQFRKEYEAVSGDDVRDVTLSHIQRGGNPTVRDRVFASLMGAKAVDLLLEGQAGIFLGLKNEQLATFDIVETLTKEKHQVRRDLYQLNQGLSAK